MRSSIDVYNKIFWDEKYQEDNFLIGYRDFQKIVELKLVNWTPINQGGDIPWHRIEYFKDQNRIVWHRSKKIDAIFNSGENNEGIIDWEQGLKSFANLNLKPLIKNLSHQWVPTDFYSINNDLEDFSIITWNILSDEFNNNKDIDHKDRYQKICDIIKSYDIICLQEATINFLQILNRQEWVAEYWLSDYQGKTFENKMGVIILSKIPCKQIYMLCDTKNTLICEFMISGYNVKIVNLHLTSDHHGNSKARRKIVLDRIHRTVKSDPSAIWFILGDFNARIDELRKSAPWLLDYDRALVAHTFCPFKNNLAYLNSNRKEDKQIDHIFITPGNNWHLLENQLINQPYSDHYGLATKIELYTGSISSDTCIVAVPPLKYWHFLLGKTWIEHSGMPGDFSYFKRYVPHISILLGYYAIDSESFDLKQIEEAFTPFYLKFDQPGGLNGAPVLLSDDNQELINLERKLRKLCPTATRHLYQGKYTPHLTILNSIDGKVIEWQVDQIYVDVKNEGKYFEHCYAIGKPPSTFDVNEFVMSLQKIFPTIKFQVIGSRFYLNDQNSDLDMICYGPTLTQDEFYDRIVWIGKSCGYFEHTYVTDSKIKIVKMFNRVIGHVDLQYIQCTKEEFQICPSTWKIKYNELELVEKSRILVLQDNLHYNKILTPEQKDLINQVKTWAKNRRIYLNCVGFLSGIVITVMVVFSKATTINEFIDFYKNLDFSKTAITEKGWKIRREGPIDQLMYVSSPIYPFNLNVKVNQSAIKWIKQELNNFTEDRLILDQIKQPYLLIDLDELGIVEWGRLTGRIINIIVFLEKRYRVFTHVIQENNLLYLFLHKEKDTSLIDSKQMCLEIRDWFFENEFYINLKFKRNR